MLLRFGRRPSGGREENFPPNLLSLPLRQIVLLCHGRLWCGSYRLSICQMVCPSRQAVVESSSSGSCTLREYVTSHGPCRSSTRDVKSRGSCRSSTRDVKSRGPCRSSTRNVKSCGFYCSSTLTLKIYGRSPFDHVYPPVVMFGQAHGHLFHSFVRNSVLCGLQFSRRVSSLFARGYLTFADAGRSRATTRSPVVHLSDAV